MALSKEEIANRYGAALFAYAQDSNCLETLHEENTALLTAVKENPNVIRVLSDPILNQVEKKKFLDAFSEPFSTEMSSFLKLLLEYDRISSLAAILENFDTRYDKFKKIAYGIVISSVPLSSDQLERLGKAYAQKYGLTQLYLKNQVDTTILGGVILQVEDRIIDGSVRTKLKKIRAQLMSEE